MSIEDMMLEMEAYREGLVVLMEGCDDKAMRCVYGILLHQFESLVRMIELGEILIEGCAGTSVRDVETGVRVELKEKEMEYA
jgi:hypothetical protein